MTARTVKGPVAIAPPKTATIPSTKVVATLPAKIASTAKATAAAVSSAKTASAKTTSASVEVKVPLEKAAQVVDHGTPPPSIRQQKSYIIESSRQGMFNRDVQREILNRVMMELGDTVTDDNQNTRKVIYQSEGVVDGRKVPYLDFDLDLIAQLNPELLTQIYNITTARVAALNQPLGS
jgi:hypothetical protein